MKAQENDIARLLFVARDVYQALEKLRGALAKLSPEQRERVMAFALGMMN